MKKLITILLIIGFVISCTATTQNIPVGCENSVIYKSGINVQQASIAMRSSEDRLLILSCIDTGKCTKEEVLKIVNSTRSFIENGNPTYNMLALFAQDSKIVLYVTLFAEVLPNTNITLLEYFTEYNTLLDDCDKDIILNELNKVENMVSMLK